MSESRDCCNLQPASKREVTCPQCGVKGQAVPAETPRHLVRPEARLRLGDMPTLFCETPHCPVVYFSGGTGPPIEKGDLVVRVGLKETEPPRLACYCFGHTMEDIEIEAEVHPRGRNAIVEEIREKVKDGLCECEVRNPKGTCCLGDLNRIVKEARERMDG